MIRSLGRLLLVAAMFLALCAFTSQPPEERKAQEALPKSHDRMWQVLGKTRFRYDDKKERYVVSFPDAVKALAGKPVTISGFIVPLEATEKFKHFILSKSTPTCAFCMPGEPDELVEVWLERPIAWDERMVKVTGAFELIDGRELGLFFRIKDGKTQRP